MTPEEAIALKTGTTPGPWKWREHQHTSYKVEGPNRDYESLNLFMNMDRRYRPNPAAERGSSS